MNDTAKPEKFDLSSLDIAAEKRAELLRLFPEARTEGGKIDVERLKAALGEAVDVGRERYGLVWPGKADCFKTIQAPSLGTLRPKPEESVNFDTTENVIIEGDNLEALRLMQKAYLGRIKLIYIDPPYNTGEDFIYPDNFSETLQTYLEYTGQVDSSGRKFGTNAETDGRFHSKWLNMMYPRLYLARNLLHEEGLIAVQIDDAELSNLRRLMDEIFGEENYVNTIAVKSKLAAGASGGGEDKRLKKNVEFLLLYARDLESLDGFTHCFVEEPLQSVIEEMREAGQSWKYTSVLLDHGTKKKIATTTDGDGKPIDIFLHEGVKRGTLREVAARDGLTEPEAYKKYLTRLFSDTNAQTSIRTRVIDAVGALKEGQMYSVEYVPGSGKDKGKQVCHYYISPTVRRVIWLSDVAYEKDGEVIKRERTGTLWDDISYNNIGKEGRTPFANGKKPLELIKRVLELSTDKDALVLDFFAGSGTTGHAVVEMNKKDGGSRRFLLVQLPEHVEQEGIQHIADITRERMRRVFEDCASQGGTLFEKDTKGGFGFRSFALDQSNFAEWNSTGAKDANELTDQLTLHTQHIREGRTNGDILYEILLKSGFPLTTSVEEKTLAGKKVFSIGGDVLLICLERKLTLDVIRAMADLKPERVVCLDEGFAGNDQLKANAVQTFRTKGVASFRTV